MLRNFHPQGNAWGCLRRARGISLGLVLANQRVVSPTPKPNRPPLSTILPSKRIVNRLLFDMDAALNYRNLYPIYEAVYHSLDGSTFALPAYATPSDLMLMRQVLAVIRKRTHVTNTHLLALENELVEKAAELGHNDAVATLAFETLNTASAPAADVAHARKLISQLFEAENALTFKLSGDLAWSKKEAAQAETLYLRFLELEPNTSTASEVYKNLGFISFLKPNLQAARRYFEQSVRFGEAENVAQCQFYLGQLAHAQPPLARHYYEMAAGQGLIEAFPALGFLEMNHFGNFAKALEWFKLGVELRNPTSLMGLFDCYGRLEQWQAAQTTLQTLHAFFARKYPDDTTKGVEWDTYQKFIETRAATIERVARLGADVKKAPKPVDEPSTSVKPPEGPGKWGA